MKHFMQPRNGILRETKMESPLSSKPSVVKPWPSRKHRGSKENALPSDPNSLRPSRSTHRHLRRQVEEPAPAATAAVEHSQ
ncbi:hypothetical protein L484_019313 [Morus notabilis]|uniref:Uncharacterized protein n=1 Tax=Morus notabilis TaxID=981085 RepID=W9QP93_9ROSA|nr:hypothetical protein L484_019313 [Morus notabilis]